MVVKEQLVQSVLQEEEGKAMLTYVLNRGGETSLYEQLYRALRADIESGALAAGARLPSKRAFAKHLGVSVVTVEGALDQLVAEGYVRAVPRSGFYVQEIGPNLASFSRISTSAEVKVPLGDSSGAKSASCRPEARISGNDGVEKLEKLARKGAPFCIAHSEEGLAGVSPGAGRKWLADFTGATAPEGVFPYAAWARTLRRVLADESERTVLEAAGPQGSPRLRAAIAAHLRGFRGMEVHPDQIVIGSGAQSLYGLLVQLLGRDLVYGVEDPGYPRLASIYRSNDVAVRPIALDEEGPSLEVLERAGIDVLHCTPSHQFPTGITVPVSRRRALVEWAYGTSEKSESVLAPRVSDGPSRPSEAKWDPENALVDECGSGKVGGMLETRSRYLIEDDFDCEFRMAGRPVPTLATLDGAGRVIYANTFSKTLGGAFRIGYVVLPEELAERFRDKLGFYTCTVGALEQLTLARFMESGDYERHVNRQRTRYRRLLGALTEALAASPAGSCLRFANVGAGLHFLMEVGIGAGDERGEGAKSAEGDSVAFEERVARRAAVRGVRLAPLSRYRFNDRGTSRRRPAFVMSFSSVKEETIPEVAGIVSEAVMAELD